LRNKIQWWDADRVVCRLLQRRRVSFSARQPRKVLLHDGMHGSAHALPREPGRQDCDR
jgi:hypothetical protein